MAKPEFILVVHYSCENFYEDKKDGRSPRVTSIAVREFKSGQTWSFSIQLVAERKHVEAVDILSRYDELEKLMLQDFFAFVREHKAHQWVHWNMRDVNYGFPAIEHRYSVLGGHAVAIPDDNKHDLARIVVALYGRRYVGHPRLPNLIAVNKITDKGILSGGEEAQKFTDCEYLALHRSTLRKVDVLCNVLERIADGSLKTEAGFFDTYGLSIKAVPEFLKEHPLIVGLSVLGVIAVAITRLFGLWEMLSGTGP